MTQDCVPQPEPSPQSDKQNVSHTTKMSGSIPKVHSPLNPNAHSPDSIATPDSRVNGTPQPANDTTSVKASDWTTMSTPTQATNGTEAGENSSKKQERPQIQPSTTAENIAEAGAGVKLTGAQLKKQKLAEKAARRAEKVAIKGEQAQAETVATKPNAQRRPSQGGNKSSEPAQTQSNHKRKGSVQPPLEPGAVRIPFRPGVVGTSGTAPVAAQPKEPKALDKRVPFVSHLYPPGKTHASLSTASKDLHPSVLTLSLQLRDHVITGGNARTIATLLVLKRVINAYTTPAGVALSRHLTTHLSHQITFLASARPLGVGQGNAIRWLKKLISTLDPDLAESEAKKAINTSIDSFIREKITLADEVIAANACSNLEDEGEVILVYAKSSVVEKTLLKAAREEGKKFRVIVVDNRPLFEGKNLARSLLRAGMREGGELEGCQVQYCLLSGLADVIEQEGVTKCILGASAMMGNGSLHSRAGTALVAAMAKKGKQIGKAVPVIVLCESVKFTAKTALDSLSMNEIGDADALVERQTSNVFTTPVAAKPEDSGKKGGGKKKAEDDSKDDEDSQKGVLEDWRETPNLFLLNLMYDVTPSEYLDMVICELGTLPPSAVPVVNGVHGGDE